MSLQLGPVKSYHYGTYNGLPAITTSHTADLLHRTCTKTEYHVPRPVDNFLSPRRIPRSAGRYIPVKIRPWKWEMSSQALEVRSSSFFRLWDRRQIYIHCEGQTSLWVQRPNPHPRDSDGSCTRLPVPNITWLTSRYASRLTHTAIGLLHSRAMLWYSGFCSTANLEKEINYIFSVSCLRFVSKSILLWIKFRFYNE